MVPTNCLDTRNLSSELKLSCSKSHFRRREKLIKTPKLLLEQVMTA